MTDTTHPLTIYATITSNGVTHVIGTKHPLYRLRYSMLSRCYNAKPREFAAYQGKGIEVCQQWRNDPHSFYQWAIDSGWKPGLSIDRKDSDGHYEPSNCQFLTISENSIKTHLTQDVRGEKAPNAVLNNERVIEIRRLLSLGVTLTRIAKDFGVSDSAIGAIKSGKTWKYLT